MKCPHIVAPALRLHTIMEIADYVHDRMDDIERDNVSIYFPFLTDAAIKKLRYHFSVVKRDPFGYAFFRRLMA